MELISYFFELLFEFLPEVHDIYGTIKKLVEVSVHIVQAMYCIDSSNMQYSIQYCCKTQISYLTFGGLNQASKAAPGNAA